MLTEVEYWGTPLVHRPRCTLVGYTSVRHWLYSGSDVSTPVMSGNGPSRQGGPAQALPDSPYGYVSPVLYMTSSRLYLDSVIYTRLTINQG